MVTSDKRSVGRVVDVRDGYLIVEAGRLRRSRRPIPREFVHAVDEAETVFVTVPRRVLHDAPEVDRRGRFDTQEAARHFGLAWLYAQTPSEGRGDSRNPARASFSISASRSVRSSSHASVI